MFPILPLEVFGLLDISYSILLRDVDSLVTRIFFLSTAPRISLTGLGSERWVGAGPVLHNPAIGSLGLLAPDSFTKALWQATCRSPTHLM